MRVGGYSDIKNNKISNKKSNIKQNELYKNNKPRLRVIKFVKKEYNKKRITKITDQV